MQASESALEPVLPSYYFFNGDGELVTRMVAVVSADELIETVSDRKQKR